MQISEAKAGAADREQSRECRQSALQLAAIVAGVLLALLVAGAGGPTVLWGEALSMLGAHGSPTARFASPTRQDFTRNLDRQKPQEQAELLLEQVISRPADSAGEIENQIEQRSPAWRGRLKWDSQLSSLTTIALNSDSEGARVSAIEVQLAAYGLTKNASTVDSLLRRAESRDHAQKIWALWGLGLLANRGVETERVASVLSAYLKVSNDNPGGARTTRADDDTRQWAVQSLALVGTSSTIQPLLDALHNDPSPLVRERAACSLAKAGMLTHQQRMSAVPQLISFSDDPALDSQTHAWAFQALVDISGQHLPNNSAAWRDWYQGSGNVSQ